MNRRLFGILVLYAVLLAGCTTSGVVPVGPNTFLITKSVWGFSGAAPIKAEAIKEAADYCASHGKVLMVTKTVENGVKFGTTPSAEIYFKALDPNDPELKHPPTIEEIVR
jgi:hypothetical protein